MDGLRVTPDLRVPDLQVSPALPGLHSALSVIATALGTCFLRQQRESEATVALLGAFHCNVLMMDFWARLCHLLVPSLRDKATVSEICVAVVCSRAAF